MHHPKIIKNIYLRVDSTDVGLIYNYQDISKFSIDNKILLSVNALKDKLGSRIVRTYLQDERLYRIRQYDNGNEAYTCLTISGYVARVLAKYK